MLVTLVFVGCIMYCKYCSILKQRTTVSGQPIIVRPNVRDFASTLRRESLSREMPHTIGSAAAATSDETCGICFSGGGTRSCAATIGYLRGLRRLGLLSNIDYITGVSGGSWAVALYKFARPSIGEDTLLDVARDLIPASAAALDRATPNSMGSVLTEPFLANLIRVMKDNATTPGLVWQKAVYETYLKALLPAGADRKSFTLSTGARDTILSQVPGLCGDDFIVARATRPFPIICISTISPPAGASRSEDFVAIDVTPLGVGSTCSRRVIYNSETDVSYGGFVEPYLFGSHVFSNGAFLVSKPLFSIAAACGASSMAMAAPVMTHGKLVSAAVSRFVPHVHVSSSPCHMPTDDATPPKTSRNDADISTTEMLVGDGGFCDNSGLLTLLARRVSRIVVFVNSLDPYIRGATAYQPPEKIDSTFRLLFEGDSVARTQPMATRNHNIVFDYVSYLQIVAQFHACFDHRVHNMPAGCCARPLHARLTDVRVKPNSFWNIDSYVVKSVCFVLLQEPIAWYHAVPNRGASAFKHFPHYKTIANNKFKLLQLTTAQVNMLSDLAAYIVESIQDVLVTCLDPHSNVPYSLHGAKRIYKL